MSDGPLVIVFRGQEIDPGHAVVAWREADNGHGLVGLNVAADTSELAGLARATLSAVLRVIAEREGSGTAEAVARDIAARAMADVGRGLPVQRLQWSAGDVID